MALGGGSWGVYGLQDQGFSNDVRESAGSFRVKMYGYNYDELSFWAEEMKKQLLSHRRIKEVNINSEFSWWKDDYTEFSLEFNKQKMVEENLTAQELFAVLQPVFMRDQIAGEILYDNSLERLCLSSRQSSEYDVWAFMSYRSPSMVSRINYLIWLYLPRTGTETDCQGKPAIPSVSAI